MESDRRQIQETSCAKILSDMKTDLRTEMTPVMGFCDMLMTKNYGNLNEAQMDRMQIINKHLIRMIDIISEPISENQS